MHPAQLACRWFGHDVGDGFTVSTGSLKNAAGNDSFKFTLKCLRCGETWSQEVSGRVAFAYAEEFT